MIIEQIKRDSVAAIKSGNKDLRLILSTILADLQTDGKDPAPEQELDKVIALSNKYKKEQIKGADFTDYLEYLSKFLPQMLTQEELTKICTENNLTNMGQAMKWFKSQPKNAFFFEPSTLAKCF